MFYQKYDLGILDSLVTALYFGQCGYGPVRDISESAITSDYIVLTSIRRKSRAAM